MCSGKAGPSRDESWPAGSQLQFLVSGQFFVFGFPILKFANCIQLLFSFGQSTAVFSFSFLVNFAKHFAKNLSFWEPLDCHVDQRSA